MSKNWLIRTKSNHILGPISRDKAWELYQNGSIKPDDEICSGNGFWFFIREDELLKQHLQNNEPQSFNPISEAKDVLTAGANGTTAEKTRDDITRIGSFAIPKSQNSQTEDTAQHNLQPSPLKKKDLSSLKHKNSRSGPAKVLKDQSYLQYVAIIGLSLIFLLVYFRKNVIKFFVDDVQAQEIVQEKKKSS